MVDGLLPGGVTTLRRDADGKPSMLVAGVDAVRRTVGLG
jgi:hypothetical protein